MIPILKMAARARGDTLRALLMIEMEEMWKRKLGTARMISTKENKGDGPRVKLAWVSEVEMVLRAEQKAVILALLRRRHLR